MNTKKVTLLSLLTAMALIIFIVEAQIPPLVPLPGVKMGLANIIVLVTMMKYGGREAFLVLMLKIFLGSIFTGAMVGLMYSFTGGIFCFSVMLIVSKLIKSIPIWAVSVLGALAHNIGQITVAILLTSTPQIAWYFSVLIISGVITGAFTGLTAELVLKRINKE